MCERQYTTRTKDQTNQPVDKKNENGICNKGNTDVRRRRKGGCKTVSVDLINILLNLEKEKMFSRGNITAYRLLQYMGTDDDHPNNKTSWTKITPVVDHNKIKKPKWS